MLQRRGFGKIQKSFQTESFWKQILWKCSKPKQVVQNLIESVQNS